MKKLLAVALALAMVLSMAACVSTPKPTDPDFGATNPTGSTTGTEGTQAPTTGTTEPGETGPSIDVDAYTADSQKIYNEILGEFLTMYNAAKECTNVSEKWAMMAQAEAKLLASGVMLPLSSNGGNYAISRVVPNTVPYVLWGNDSYRLHSILVCTEPLTTGDRAELKAMWNELKGSGTYITKAKEFLASKGYTLKDTYNQGYSSDPTTWDVLNSSQAVDSEPLVMTYDGLMEYNEEGILSPALAEKYEVSEDGLTYTFTIREGAKWVDSQGRTVADVTADDFVAGMQHMMDAQAGLEYLVDGVIKGSHAYIEGETSDFSTVGVKADGNKVIYTLEAPCTYFMTMLGYGVFAPLSRTYYESQGGTFGEAFDSSAESYAYGKDPDHIAYCGPYLVTNATEKNTIVFTANESYWNKDVVTAKTVTWLYNDGSEATKAYNDMKAGTIDGAGLNSAALEAAKKDGLFDKYHYVSSTDATSFMAFNNVNRIAYVNANDGVSAPTTLSETERDRTNKAMRNAHFRLALCMALDRGGYNAQSVGEDLKLVSLRNTYTPGNFVQLTEEVTIKINGTDTTFKAGTNYGEIMQAQLNADGIKVTVWNPEADEGFGSSDGYDGWYSAENAVEQLNKAIEELGDLNISAENPITIELPYPANSQGYTNRANAYKQSVEASLGGKVKVELTKCENFDPWQYAGYWTDYGYESNYTVYDLSGWGPDYGDPATYLDTFLPDYAGYMLKCIGLF